ncbi:hypothetical protein TNCV_3533311 [Trichonephila clavipes]|nr:hypothetical protein TNCV_3533311 [Trichonephila clavipes]
MGRLRFTGHICRKDPSSLTFRIFNYKPIETRTRARPKLRWADCVEDDGTVAKRSVEKENGSKIVSVFRAVREITRQIEAVASSDWRLEKKISSESILKSRR